MPQNPEAKGKGTVVRAIRQGILAGGFLAAPFLYPPEAASRKELPLEPGKFPVAAATGEALSELSTTQQHAPNSHEHHTERQAHHRQERRAVQREKTVLVAEHNAKARAERSDHGVKPKREQTRPVTRIAASARFSAEGSKKWTVAEATKSAKDIAKGISVVAKAVSERLPDSERASAARDLNQLEYALSRFSRATDGQRQELGAKVADIFRNQSATGVDYEGVLKAFEEKYPEAAGFLAGLGLAVGASMVASRLGVKRGVNFLLSTSILLASCSPGGVDVSTVTATASSPATQGGAEATAGPAGGTATIESTPSKDVIKNGVPALFAGLTMPDPTRGAYGFLQENINTPDGKACDLPFYQGAQQVQLTEMFDAQGVLRGSAVDYGELENFFHLAADKSGVTSGEWNGMEIIEVSPGILMNTAGEYYIMFEPRGYAVLCEQDGKLMAGYADGRGYLLEPLQPAFRKLSEYLKIVGYTGDIAKIKGAPKFEEANGKLTGNLFVQDEAGNIIVVPYIYTGIPMASATPIEILPSATPTLENVAPLVYSVEGAEWFGGFTIDIHTDADLPVGFTDPIQGPKDLYTAILTMILVQSGGKYGSTIGEVASYLKTHTDTDFVCLKVDKDASRVPPWVKPSEPMPLDLSKGMKIQRAHEPPPGCDAVRLDDSRFWSSLTVVDGQLVFTETDAYPLVPPVEGSFTGRLWELLEATAQIYRASSYPQARPDDFMSRLSQAFIDSYQTGKKASLLKLNPGVFVYKGPDGKPVWMFKPQSNTTPTSTPSSP